MAADMSMWTQCFHDNSAALYRGECKRTALEVFPSWSDSIRHLLTFLRFTLHQELWSKSVELIRSRRVSELQLSGFVRGGISSEVVTNPVGAPDVDGSVLHQRSRVTVPCRHLDHPCVQHHLAWYHLGAFCRAGPTQGALVVTAKCVNLRARVSDCIKEWLCDFISEWKRRR